MRNILFILLVLTITASGLSAQERTSRNSNYADINSAFDSYGKALGNNKKVKEAGSEGASFGQAEKKTHLIGIGKGKKKKTNFRGRKRKKGCNCPTH